MRLPRVVYCSYARKCHFVTHITRSNDLILSCDTLVLSCDTPQLSRYTQELLHARQGL